MMSFAQTRRQRIRGLRAAARGISSCTAHASTSGLPCAFSCMAPRQGASQVALVGKNPPANAGDIRDSRIEPGVQSLDQEDPLKEGMATHSSILA